MRGNLGPRGLSLRTPGARRLPGAWLVVALVAGAACDASPSPDGARPAPDERPEGRPPNVLVIVTDDQPVGTLGIMPEVRRWFREGGTTFSRAVVTTPLCCPSRGTILTGRYAHNHGLTTNVGRRGLEEGTTLPELLREAGYRTAIVGKYLNRWDLDRAPPGFDRWTVFDRGYRDVDVNVDGSRRTVRRYVTDFLADRSLRYLRWLERGDDRPWLLYVATSAPHGPFEPASRHADAPVPSWSPPAEEDRSDKPPHVRDREPEPDVSRSVRDGQLRTLMSVDELVGRVMRGLGDGGDRRDTLAVFVSDNGYLLGEHGVVDGKRMPYLPAVRVPLLMRWPGRVEAGATDDRLVANLDLVPTVLDAAGVDPPGDVDGRSLLDGHARRRVLLEYWPGGVPTVPPWAATLTAGHQYVEYYGPDGETVTFREHYDLREDPDQLENLMARGEVPPRRAERLAAVLAADRTCRGTTGASACP